MHIEKSIFLIWRGPVSFEKKCIFYTETQKYTGSELSKLHFLMVIFFSAIIKKWAPKILKME